MTRTSGRWRGDSDNCAHSSSDAKGVSAMMHVNTRTCGWIRTHQPLPYSRPSLIVLILVIPLVALALFPVATLAVLAPTPTPAPATPGLLGGGPGNQTDPHISGTLVSYTNTD